ncbi:MAG: hypothetical protein R3B96_17085 [Pirellulaceae bacterium]
MMSIARDLVARDWSGEIHFVFATRTEADIIFRQELQELADRNPRFTC